MNKQKTYSHSDARGRRSSTRPDLNMTELAGVVGVSPSYLSKLFSGIGTPSVPLAQALAREMNLPLEQLLNELSELSAGRAHRNAKDSNDGKDGKNGKDGNSRNGRITRITRIKK